MDNLIFYTFLIALSYYFLYHLPNQKTRPNPLTSTKSTQTEDKVSAEQTSPDPETEKLTPAQQDLENSLDQLIKGINDLNKELD